jgi:hypothetical protein
MPWRCPACQTQIEHGPGGDLPMRDTVYRCHVCRLELVFDYGNGRLTVAPIRSDRDATPPPKRI